MEFKGTKEKWYSIFTSGNKRAVRSKGGIICELLKPFHYQGQEERYEHELEEVKANQKLIECAPELLEELSETLKFLNWIEEQKFSMWSDKQQSMYERISKAKQLISKATGNE